MNKLLIFTLIFAPFFSFEQTCNKLNHNCSNTVGLTTSGMTSSIGSIYSCGPGNSVLYSSSTNAYIATGDISVAQGSGATLHFKAKRAASYSGTSEVWVHVGGYCNYSVLSFPFDANGWVQIGTFNPTTTCSTFGPFTVPSDVIGGQKISYCIVPKNASSTNWVAIDDICVSEISGSSVATAMNEDFGNSSTGWYPNSGVADIPYHTYKNASDAYVILGTGVDGGSDKAAYFYTGFDFCSTVSGTGIVTKEINTSSYTNGEIRVEFKSKYPCSGSASYTFDENYQSYSPDIYVMQGADHGSNTWVQLPVNYYFADYSWRVASYDISAYQNANVRFKIERGGFCGTSMEAIDNIKILDRNCAISSLLSGPISGNTAPVQNTNYVYTIPSVVGATYYKWYVRSGGTLYDASPYIVSGQGTQSATINFNALPSSGVRVLCIPFDADPSLDTDACYAKIAYLGVTVSAVSPLVFDNVDTIHVSCNGASDGSVTLNVSGGTPGYTYTWVPNVSITNTATGLVGGNYQITVTDSNLDQIVANVIVNEPAVLSSGLISTASICQGDSVKLSSFISGGTSPYSYTWTPAIDISDPSSAEPYVYPPVTGLSTYSLDVVDANGCTLSTSSSITVVPNPTANFIASDECLGLANCFVDLSTIQAGGGAISSWTYDFGDASSLDLNQNTCHSYAMDGTYTAQLLVESTDGCKDSVALPVNVYALPIADFVVSNECLGSANAFEDISTILAGNGTVTSWDWDFGDASSSNSGPLVSHQYALQGTYSATLVITSSNGCINSVTYPVLVHPLPVPAFTASSVCLGASNCFADNSSTLGGGSAISAWNWNFGDASGFSVDQNPCYQYGADGIYSVELTITTTDGCSNSITNPVVVHPLPAPSFIVSALSGCGPIFVDFSSTTPGTVVSCDWSFGDGNLFSGCASVSNTYATSGFYEVELTVMNDFGCSNSDTLDLLLSDCMSISDLSTDKIQVYPNPANEIITVHGLCPEAQIQVKDINGRVVVYGISQGVSHTISIASLATGTYLLEVQTRSSLKTIKFIKE